MTEQSLDDLAREQDIPPTGNLESCERAAEVLPDLPDANREEEHGMTEERLQALLALTPQGRMTTILDLRQQVRTEHEARVTVDKARVKAEAEVKRLRAAVPKVPILRGAAKLLRLAGEQIYAERICIDADRLENALAEAAKGETS
jgi:DNA topoisomerase VI subunit B